MRFENDLDVIDNQVTYTVIFPFFKNRRIRLEFLGFENFSEWEVCGEVSEQFRTQKRTYKKS